MKLAIMQPYFLPYIGYFSLIKHTDSWVVFDDAQFIRHGWIERNRILKPNGGWQYIKVPLIKHHREALIKDVRIRNTENWCKKILGQLEHYKKKAPFYKSTISILEELCSLSYNSIVKLNAKSLELVCNKLNIDFNYQFSSNLDLNTENILEPDDWALEITDLLGFDTYINPYGGREIFNKEKYQRRGVALKFLKVNLNEYNQKNEYFESGLSIIDVMMFNSPNTITAMLDNVKVE